MNRDYASLTKFELARILVPGIYFAALVEFFTRTFIDPRLALSHSPGGSLLFFLIVALVSGLTLYAKETPKRRRAFIENQPSAHVQQLARALPKSAPLSDDEAKHAYYYVLNNIMPATIQEKVFLFGTVYYVMIQIRRTSFWFGLAGAAIVLVLLAGQPPLADLHGPFLFTVLVWLVYVLNVRYNKADRKMQENYRDQIFWLDVHRAEVQELLKKIPHPSSK